MKELKIGEEMCIRCVDYGDCDRCCFLNTGCKNIICDAQYRTDGRNVHFEIVEEHIDEEELDKVATDYTNNVGQGIWQELEAYKAGYRKAIENL